MDIFPRRPNSSNRLAYEPKQAIHSCGQVVHTLEAKLDEKIGACVIDESLPNRDRAV
jgi:hypothetical protein